VEKEMNEKQLQALIRKNAAKAERAQKQKQRPAYDKTLDATRSPDAADESEAEEIFKEMKKREF
jgi:hypothetical protein